MQGFILLLTQYITIRIKVKPINTKNITVLIVGIFLILINIYAMQQAVTHGYSGFAGAEQAISPASAMIGLFGIIITIFTVFAHLKKKYFLSSLIFIPLTLISVLNCLYAIFGR
jgi:uncharacterized protein YacL